MSAPTIDEDKLEAFMGRFVQDMGAGATAPLVLIGDKLGLYKAMADGAPVTPAELAERTGCRERYLREWLSQQAASGYVEYDRGPELPAPAEQALALRGRRQPGVHPGRVPAAGGDHQGRAAHHRALPLRRGLRLARARPDLFEGTERFFRPGYLANLVDSWLPSLEGVVAKLEAGARRRRRRLRPRRVDDPDGRRRTRAPRSSAPTTTRARSRPRAAPPSAPGVADRVTFEVASAKEVAGGPVRPGLRVRRAARHGRPRRRCPQRPARSWRRTAPGWSSSRSRATRWRSNLTPVGPRVLRGLDDALHPASLSQEVGSRSAPRPARSGSPQVLREGGFTRVRRSAQTPFNLVLEARP
jgi:hypothetical protein